MIQFFCLHHTPAVDRKEYLLPFFEKEKININWIEDYLPTSDDVTKFGKIYYENCVNRKYLNNAEISLTLKHNKAIKMLAESNYESAVIFEDDLEIPDFPLLEKIKEVNNLLISDDGDLLFIGSYGNCDLDKDFPHAIWHQPWMRSRCTHCYLITKKTAIKIQQFMSDVIAPPDWQLNIAIEKFSLKTYWARDHVYQRSEKRKIKSLLIYPD
jgi:hypothetical protein